MNIQIIELEARLLAMKFWLKMDKVVIYRLGYGETGPIFDLASLPTIKIRKEQVALVCSRARNLGAFVPIGRRGYGFLSETCKWTYATHAHPPKRAERLSKFIRLQALILLASAWKRVDGYWPAALKRRLMDMSKHGDNLSWQVLENCHQRHRESWGAYNPKNQEEENLKKRIMSY
jgi:hypothetical protein